MSTRPPIPLMRTYVKRLKLFAGMRRLSHLGSLMVLGAGLEGIGLALLVPMLESLNRTGSSWRPLGLASFGVTTALPALLGVFVLLITLRAIVIRQRDLTLLRLRLDFIDHLRLQLQRALAGADWRFLNHLNHAEVTQVLVADLARINQGTQFLMQGLGSITMGLAGIVVAMSISPELTLLALALAAVASLLMRRRLGAAMRMGTALSQANRRFFASLADFLGGLKIIKASATEQRHIARFEHDASSLQDQQLAFAASQSNTRALFEVATAITLAGLLWGASSLLHLAVAQLLIIVAVFARLLPMVRDWSQQFQQLMHMLPAFDDYEQWLARCQAAAEEAPEHTGRTLPLGQCLSLHGVHYQHGHSARGLHGVTLTMRAFQTTALVGPSGAGKTTLVDLVLGLLTPTAGQISVDGTPLTGQAQAAWRRSTAYVPQDAFLFPDSIRQNLTLFQPNADDDALWQALAQAAAADFVKALPHGLDTIVGERGATLSGGERQRLALARALLGRPQLLVLDEATSHLDTENEQRIQAALSSLHGQVTILLVAHRLSTVRHADQIVVMEEGHVVQTGEWHSLSQQPGLFQRLQAAAA